MELKDKAALIVGAGTVIGRAAAASLTDAGALVSLIDTPGPGLDSVAAALGREAQVLPLTGMAWDQPARLVHEVHRLRGRVDILVFSVPPLAPRHFLDVSTAEWDDAVASVVELGTRFVQESAQLMPAGGRVVFALPAAALMSFPLSATASAACAALETISQVAAVDLGPRGIAVNSVVYGWVESEGPSVFHIPLQQANAVTPGIPMGRIASPAEVAAAIRFLVGPQAGYISGTQLKVDGGYLISRSGGRAFPPEVIPQA